MDKPFPEVDTPPPPPLPSGEEREIELSDELDDQPQVRSLIAGSAVGQRMVQIALSQRGVAEAGGEDAGVPYERYAKPFGYTRPVPWCACFVSWCYWQTTGARPPWKRPGYVGSVHNWAESRGKLVQDPSFGDMFGISDQHMGMVVARKRNGTFLTIEGNWEDRVLSQSRPIAGHWFATPTLG